MPLIGDSRDAEFPNYKTLDTFDFKEQPSINKLLVTELMRGEYIDKKENVLLVGIRAPEKHTSLERSGSLRVLRESVFDYVKVTESITQLMEARECRPLSATSVLKWFNRTNPFIGWFSPLHSWQFCPRNDYRRDEGQQGCANNMTVCHFKCLFVSSIAFLNTVSLTYSPTPCRASNAANLTV